MRLMAVDSTSGREGEVIAQAEQLLRELGWRTTRIPVTPGRDNLLATSDNAPLVTLSTHLDTVPPYIAPRRDAGRLHGRGACDAKGIAAAMIVAAGKLRDAGMPVALLFVVGEETTHDGAHAANRFATSSRVLINGEPTENRLALGTKGAVRLRVRTTGRAAHSAYPHLGDSATERLVALLATLPALELPHDEVLGATTVNIGSLSGGVADNVIAPWAEARLMARLVGPVDETLARFMRWADGRADIDVGETVPAVRLTSIAGFETDVVAYATDVPNLSTWGTPYLLGPGTIHVAHTDDESVGIDELEDAVGLYVKLAMAAGDRVRG
ncbi:MAG: M20/M25/M40 family metallo-hydrolase [Gemmatimonadaceae bacterium]|nr:M20/M25/M40 family metallo-hydrolase [Gemmatimonadaceae bacterium]